MIQILNNLREETKKKKHKIFVTKQIEKWIELKANSLHELTYRKRENQTRTINVDNLVKVTSSRKINNIVIEYDNNISGKSYYQNISDIYIDYRTNYEYKGKYEYTSDTVIIRFGAKYIKLHKENKLIIDGILTLPVGRKFYTLDININHRLHNPAEEIKVNFNRIFVKKKRINGNYVYAHGRSEERAIKSLQFKIQTIKKEIKLEKLKKKIKFNTLMGVRLYRVLTGACLDGCIMFCKSHGLKMTEKMRVSDLLKLLSPRDYGYKQLIQILDINIK